VTVSHAATLQRRRSSTNDFLSDLSFTLTLPRAQSILKYERQTVLCFRKFMFSYVFCWTEQCLVELYVKSFCLKMLFIARPVTMSTCSVNMLTVCGLAYKIYCIMLICYAVVLFTCVLLYFHFFHIYCKSHTQFCNPFVIFSEGTDYRRWDFALYCTAKMFYAHLLY